MIAGRSVAVDQLVRMEAFRCFWSIGAWLHYGYALLFKYKNIEIN